MTRGVPVHALALMIAFLLLLAPSSRLLAQRQPTGAATLAQEYEAAVALENRGDYPAAFALYQKGADAGYPDAQNALGYLYTNGLGTGQDPVKALYWFKRATEHNHASAQRNVALWYVKHDGGIERNHDIVLEWLRRSVDQGYLPAVFDLGKLLAWRMVDGSDEGQLEGLRLIQLAAQPGRDFQAVRKDAREVLPQVTAHLRARGILAPPPQKRPAYCSPYGGLHPSYACPGLAELSEPGPRAQCLERQKEMERICKQFQN